MMVWHMARTLVLMLALTTSILPFTCALADDAKDKPAAVSTEATAQPKIRVILPALWEPAAPQAATQTASSQRSAAR
jgi:hypothetical protein